MFQEGVRRLTYDSFARLALTIHYYCGTRTTETCDRGEHRGAGAFRDPTKAFHTGCPGDNSNRPHRESARVESQLQAVV
ncbi:hypothetical protein KSF_002630 [Reticulibacter mediterranei]|uniref:Uncharacterized protein n=1 Tax=Reticulibacter mediterranei TaxID=2778369 RepID=A0A8J3ID30_9CHLR|nr:hypothetical protein KSF_002630 [Reticulibacter mediterranei]